MTTKLVALTLLPLVLVGGVVMSSSILMVDVHEAGGTHLVVPVPLALAQLGLALAPDEIKYVDIDEAGRYLPYLERIVDELRDAPDGLFVEVEDGSDHVRVYKEADALKVEVDERGSETVRVSVPLASVAGIVDAWDEERRALRLTSVVGALRAAPSGDLVHVIDGDDEVRVRMW